jgi:hypothetical protein
MGIERPDDADVPSDQHADQSANHADAPGDGSARSDQSGTEQVEIRDRNAYYSDLHEAVSGEKRDEVREWDEEAKRFCNEWDEHLRRWPAEKRTPIDRSGDPPGSWRGDSNRPLDRASNEYVEDQCDQIAQLECDIISPAMCAIESQDSGRRLVGYDHRLKSRDGIKDKVAAGIDEKGRTAHEGMSMIKDAIRFTFAYRQESYADGVQADLARMEVRGFTQVERRNSWTEDQYKGINSRWREPTTGQLFEVQFHTEVSFEAKQITHKAYERIRNPNTSRAELRELRSFQRGVCERIPVPPGAADIPDYP